MFTNPNFNATPIGETITGSGTFTGGGWDVTSGTLYVGTGVYNSFPTLTPHHLEFGNDAVLPNANIAASVQQMLAMTSTAPGTTYDISFDWVRDVPGGGFWRHAGDIWVECLCHRSLWSRRR